MVCLLFSVLILTGVFSPLPGWSLDVKLSPSPGLYPDPIQVSISVPKGTRVYYTLDGSEPGTDSAEYTGKVSIEKNTVIRFFTVDQAGVRGVMEEALFRIGGEEVSPQSLVTVADPPGGNFAEKIRVRLMAEKGAAIYYSIDGSDPDTSSLVYLSPIPLNTDTVLKFFAVDANGERETIRQERYSFSLIDYVVDTTHPEVRAVPGPEEFRVGDRIKLEADERSNIFYTLDGTEPTTDSFQYVEPFMIDRSLVLKFVAFDWSGNKGEVVSVEYILDNTAPSSIAAPGSGLYVPPLFVKLSADDDEAIIYYTVDGSTPDTSSRVYREALVITSDTTLRFFSFDRMGNAETIKKERYRIDGKPPLTESDLSGGEYKPPISVTLETEEGGRIYYTIDGSDPDEHSPLYSSALIFFKPTTLKFFAIDTAGNREDIQTRRYNFINGVWRKYSRGVFLIPSVTDGKTFWMGSEAGLVIYSVSSGSRKFIGEREGLLGNVINDLVLDEGSNLWVATESGVNMYKGGKEFDHINRNAGLPANEVLSLGVDIDNSIWAGTKKGAAHIRDGLVVGLLTKKDGLLDDTVLSITVDAHGNKWFGTRKGLSKFTGSEWNHYTEDSGLVDDEVRTIAIDSDWNVWCGTSRGISVYDGAKWKNYKKSDGLPGNAVILIAPDPDGEVWVATRSGVARFSGEKWIKEESP